MKLGDQQRCWNGNFSSVDTIVILEMAGDVHLGMVPNSCFQPECASCRLIVVRWDLAGSPTPETG